MALANEQMAEQQADLYASFVDRRISSLPPVAVATNTTLSPASHVNKLVRVDATGVTERVITLPTVNVDVGTRFLIMKSDAGTGRVKISTTELGAGWLNAKGDAVQVNWNGAAWEVIYRNIATLRTLYTAPGTLSHSLNPFARRVRAVLHGGGGGGGSGRRGAAGTIRLGGGGGAGGSVSEGEWERSKLSSNVELAVGAGGAGGSAISVDNTNGNAGQSGSPSRFGQRSDSYFRRAAGGAEGSGAGAGGAALTLARASGSGATSSTSGGTSGGRGWISGGAAGGSITSANVAQGGGAGVDVDHTLLSATPVGDPGAAGPTPLAACLSPAASGSGGGASVTAAAGAGGAGGQYGGGGGGGGASSNGFASGAGGAGGDGAVEIWEFF